MEKRILCCRFACQFMDIIQNQHINQLIKMQEVIDFIFPHGFRKLGLEQIGRYIQDHLFRKILFHFQTNSLSQVSFSQSGTAINK